MRLYNMIGYKLFKEREDGSIHMIRIVGMRKPFKITDTTKDPSEITIYDYDTKERKKVRVDTLKEYSPLKPDAIATFSIVNIRDTKGDICKDVIVTATKFLNIEFKVNVMPYAVCRQNITDIFYNLMSKSEDDNLVGLAINQDNCPANFDFGIMFAADSIVYSDFINFYRLDSMDDILSLIDTKKYDDVLSGLFNRYINKIGKPELSFKNEAGGWCKNLKTLVTENNFMSDINEMLGIIQVDFNVANYLETAKKDDIEYSIARDDFRAWLSSVYSCNMKEVAVMEFDHDINLADFNNTSYILMRDKSNKLYLMVYITAGEYFEADLEEKAKEMDFSTKFKLSFINSKYNVMK